ncbi:MAG: hypothetical protein WBQ75_23605 [Acetobacteraceae bacterium]
MFNVAWIIVLALCLPCFIPANARSDDLPRGFNGDNVHAIVDGIIRLHPEKDRFESKAAHIARLEGMANSEITRGRAMSDEVTFVDGTAVGLDKGYGVVFYDPEQRRLFLGPPKPDGVPISCFADSAECDIDADHIIGRSSVTDSELVATHAYATKSREYIGSNVFGVQKRVESSEGGADAVVLWPQGQDYPVIAAGLRSIHLEPQEARRMSARRDVKLAFRGHLVSPFLLTTDSYYPATLNSPYQVISHNRVLNMKVSEIILFEQKTGAIILTVRVP